MEARRRRCRCCPHVMGPADRGERVRCGSPPPGRTRVAVDRRASAGARGRDAVVDTKGAPRRISGRGRGEPRGGHRRIAIVSRSVRGRSLPEARNGAEGAELDRPIAEFTLLFGIGALQLSPDGRSIAALTPRRDGRATIHIGRAAGTLTPNRRRRCFLRGRRPRDRVDGRRQPHRASGGPGDGTGGDGLAPAGQWHRIQCRAVHLHFRRW